MLKIFHDNKVKTNMLQYIWVHLSVLSFKCILGMQLSEIFTNLYSGRCTFSSDANM